MNKGVFYHTAMTTPERGTDVAESWRSGGLPVKRFLGCALAVLLGVAVVRSQAPVDVRIDAAANRHPIDARIYGVAFADAASLADLRVPIHRWGGNATTRYNWQPNARNRASDWYFASIASGSR